MMYEPKGQCATTAEQKASLADPKRKWLTLCTKQQQRPCRDFHCCWGFFYTVVLSSTPSLLFLFHSILPTTIRVDVLINNVNIFWFWCPSVYSCTVHLLVFQYANGSDLTDTCCVLRCQLIFANLTKDKRMVWNSDGVWEAQKPFLLEGLRSRWKCLIAFLLFAGKLDLSQCSNIMYV